MAAPHHWPEADCIEALRLKATGLTWRQIGAVFGKSKSSAESACRRHQGLASNHREDYSYSGPAIGLEMSEIHSKKRAKNASTSLRRAIEALIDRMPASEVAEMLGKPHLVIPGMERVYRGQGAEREFARPIGEIIAPIVAGIMNKAEAA